jgi:hypothetical protein
MVAVNDSKNILSVLVLSNDAFFKFALMCIEMQVYELLTQSSGALCFILAGFRVGCNMVINTQEFVARGKLSLDELSGLGSKNGS